MTDHLFERGIRLTGLHDLHHLDLVELMLPYHAARVPAVAAGLGAKTRRVRGEFDRQAFGWQDFIAHGVGQRDFGSRNQIQRLALADLTTLLDGKQIGFELG